MPSDASFAGDFGEWEDNMSDIPDRRVLASIAARATRDAAFRKRLIEDPHAAILEATGACVPPGLRIKFVEKDPEVDVMIVLPSAVLEDGELCEEDVEYVAGGTNWGCQDVSTE
jgi:hypothetical protein